MKTKETSNRIDIDQYIDWQEYYEKHLEGVKKSTGGWFSAKCPFHDDKENSFAFKPESSNWKCYAGCAPGNGKGNNGITFHAKLFFGDNTSEAYKDLIHQYVEGKDPMPKSKREKSQTKNTETKKPPIKPEVWKSYPQIPQKIKERYFRDKGWTEEGIQILDIRHGVFHGRSDGTILPENDAQFTHRVSIPVFDKMGFIRNIIGYNPDATEKWKKFKPFATGYGKFRLLPAAPKEEDDTVYIMEGISDLVCAISHGLNAITGTMQSGLWTKQDKEMFRGKQVIICQDVDKPGSEHALRTAKMLRGTAKSLHLIQWPEFMHGENGNIPPKKGQDFSDFISKHCKTVEDFKALPLIDITEVPIVDPQGNIIPNGQYAQRFTQDQNTSQNSSQPKDTRQQSEQILPVVDVTHVQLSQKKDEVWDIINNYHDDPNNNVKVFKHMMGIVRLIDIDGQLMIDPLTTDKMTFFLSDIAIWVKKRVTKESVLMENAMPPERLCRVMLADDSPPLPSLRRIVSHPFFTKTGKLHSKQGYMKESECFYINYDNRLNNINIPDKPNDEEVANAKAVIDDMLVDFPFTSDAEKANAIALMILPFVREMIEGPTPLHIIGSPAPGTGKTLLAKTLAFPALGYDMEFITDDKNESEFRKKITSKMLKASPFIFMDNIKYKIDSGIWSALLTSNVWEDRLLGGNTMVTMRIFNAWVVSGNNLSLSDEIARRSVRIRINSKMSRPELRNDIEHDDILKWCGENRKKIVTALLILVQHWIAKGKPEPEEVSRIGSYEQWRYVVGGVLETAGIPGFIRDFQELCEESVEEDNNILWLCHEWYEKFMDNKVSASDIYGLIEDHEIPIALHGKDERIQKIHLGRKLQAVKERYFDMYSIHSQKGRGNKTLYWLQLDDNISDDDPEDDPWESNIPYDYKEYQQLKKYIRYSEEII